MTALPNMPKPLKYTWHCGMLPANNGSRGFHGITQGAGAHQGGTGGRRRGTAATGPALPFRRRGAGRQPAGRFPLADAGRRQHRSGTGDCRPHFARGGRSRSRRLCTRLSAGRRRRLGCGAARARRIAARRVWPACRPGGGAGSFPPRRRGGRPGRRSPAGRTADCAAGQYGGGAPLAGARGDTRQRGSRAPARRSALAHRRRGGGPLAANRRAGGRPGSRLPAGRTAGGQGRRGRPGRHGLAGTRRPPGPRAGAVAVRALLRRQSRGGGGGAPPAGPAPPRARPAGRAR